MKKILHILYGIFAIFLSLVSCVFGGGKRLKPNIPIDVIETVDHNLSILLKENQLTPEQHQIISTLFHEDIKEYQEANGIPYYMTQAYTFFSALEKIEELEIENPDTKEKVNHIAYVVYTAIARDSYLQLTRTLVGFPGTNDEFYKWMKQYTYDKGETWRKQIVNLEELLTELQVYPVEQIKTISQLCLDYINQREQQPDQSPEEVQEKAREIVATVEELSKPYTEIRKYYVFTVMNILDTYEYEFNDEDQPETWKEYYGKKKAALTDNQGEYLYYETQSHLFYLIKAEMITLAEGETLKEIMLTDIDTLCRKKENITGKESIRKQIKKSLSRLKKLHLDTEDREFIAETYYTIASQNDLNMADEIDEWLYGKFLNLLTKTTEKAERK